MVGYLKKTYVTSCSIYELWFEPFILGIYKRMGNEVYQDQVVILEGIHKLMEKFALAYSHNKLREEKEGITGHTIFVSVAFLAALRGEEVFKLVLGEARNYMVGARDGLKLPHLVLPLRGKFKGETGETFTLWL